MDNGTAVIVAEEVLQKAVHNIRPYADRVLLKPVQADVNKSAGGVYLPDNMRSDSLIRYGKIVAVGSGRFVDHHALWQRMVVADGDGGMDLAVPPHFLAVGDTVLYHSSRGIPFRHEAVDYVLLAEQDIQAVIPAPPVEEV